eukprot:evm.model.scf_1846.3 EVM.evm.TU.scf_1846.3   scf_1846:23028-29045(-)
MQAAGANRALAPAAAPAVKARCCGPARVGRRGAARVTCMAAGATEPKKVLLMGGSRFIGVYLSRMLIEAGHDVTLYTRGKKDVAYQIPDDTDESYAKFAASVHHIKGDRKGKLETEDLLDKSGVNWTSLRPVYIYGPLNYNPVEEWFFHRIKAGRPVPVPGSGMQITQLGHVKDLASAFVKVLANPTAYGQIYNISGERYVTFDGLALACAEAMGAPEPELVHYDPKSMDFGKAKAFPFRDQHFFASIDKAERQLDWKPEFGLVDGLRDSYQKDFGRGNYRKEADFTTDDMVLEKVKGVVAV